MMFNVKKILCVVSLSFVAYLPLYAQVLDDDATFESDVPLASVEPQSGAQQQNSTQVDLSNSNDSQHVEIVVPETMQNFTIYNQSDVHVNDNGIVVDSGNNPVTGEVRDYYPDSGRVLTKIIYKNGIKNGYHRIFFQSGTYASDTNYVNGKEEGVAKVFYPNGEDRLSITFKQGVAINGYCVNSRGKRIDMTTAQLRKFLDEYETPCGKF